MTTAVQTRMATADDGRDLCIEVAGGGVAGTVLVCGGTPNSRHLGPRWVEDALERGLRLIGYDRPGYGASDPCPGRTIADGAADVRAVAAAVGADRLGVWGFSGGAPYALACAALLPDLVAAAATIGSPAPYGAPGLDYFAGMGEDNVEGVRRYFENPDEERKETQKAREQMLALTPARLLEEWKTLLSPVDVEVLTGEFAEFLAESLRDGLAPGDQGWWDDDVADLSAWGFDLGRVAVPVKISHGRHDRFVPFQHGEWLAAHVPGAESALSETDGHLSLLVDVGYIHEWLLRQL